MVSFSISHIQSGHIKLDRHFLKLKQKLEENKEANKYHKKKKVILTIFPVFQVDPMNVKKKRSIFFYGRCRIIK